MYFFQKFLALNICPIATEQPTAATAIPEFSAGLILATSELIIIGIGLNLIRKNKD